MDYNRSGRLRAPSDTQRGRVAARGRNRIRGLSGIHHWLLAWLESLMIDSQACSGTGLAACVIFPDFCWADISSSFTIMLKQYGTKRLHVDSATVFR